MKATTININAIRALIRMPMALWYTFVVPVQDATVRLLFVSS